MILGLKWEQWLGFSVVAAVISTLGTLVGIVLRDLFLARSLETWKRRQSLRQVYQRFRDPLLLSARELCARLIEVLDQYPTVYLKQSVLEAAPACQEDNTIADPYFQRYKLVSTVYRLCAFLAWIELYRREIVFLHSGKDKHARLLEKRVEAIRGDLADGQLNTAPDWETWRDTLMFREELRAIGECIFQTTPTGSTVMGYGLFADKFDGNGGKDRPRWVRVVLNFLLDLHDTGKDFRKSRIERLVVHLVDLMEGLDEARIAEFFIENRRKLTVTLQEQCASE
jgi:hypothetical protein